MHTSTLRAAGGSIAVTIVQALAKSTGLHPGFEFDAGRLIISPISRRKGGTKLTDLGNSVFVPHNVPPPGGRHQQIGLDQFGL